MPIKLFMRLYIALSLSTCNINSQPAIPMYPGHIKDVDDEGGGGRGEGGGFLCLQSCRVMHALAKINNYY